MPRIDVRLIGIPSAPGEYMRTLVFEPDASGHRLHFAGLVAEALLDLGHDVLFVTSRRAPATESWHEFVAPIASSVSVATVDVPDHLASARLALARSRWLAASLRRHGADHVYIPNGDGLSQIAAAIPSVRLSLRRAHASSEALILRPRFAYPADGIVGHAKRAASAYGIRHHPWTLVHHLDPLAIESTPWLDPETRAHSLMPEPVEQLAPVEREVARAALGLNAGDRYVVLPGVIDERKGAHLLLRAFAEASLPRGTRLLLAGTVPERVRLTIKSDYPALLADGSLVMLDRFLSSEEFWLAFCAADLIAAPYPDHIGSSGVIARAAYLGRPVISSGFGWVGEATRRYRLGTAVNVRDPRAFADSLESALEAAFPFVPDPASRDYVRFNTPNNFRSLWTRGIRGEGLEGA